MPKEDRSDWVAVAPEFSATTDKIRPATSAFTFFQRDVTEAVKAEIYATGEKFQVGEFTKAVRDRWVGLDPEKKAHYEALARDEQARFAQESHAADVAALERRERLQGERGALLLDEEGGTKRGTRGQRAKKERKRERKEKKKDKKVAKKRNDADNEDFVEEDESSDSYHAGDNSGESSDSYDSDDSDRPKKPKKAPRQFSQKQIEVRQKNQQEKLEKEAIIAERQEDLRKDKASQAKRRLEFLLKQSNIFSHFGQVKQDQAKYGIKTNTRKSEDGKGSSRRYTADDEPNDEDLAEADTHQATFLTSQPTTIGFGKMRQYQLEGLNWMIRLQENGVNGILADEVRAQPLSLSPTLYFSSNVCSISRWALEKLSNRFLYWFTCWSIKKLPVHI
jgi:SWI/SNF-related matrix-associated actin-dependent regulator of chromatin subfamily A member 5